MHRPVLPGVPECGMARAARRRGLAAVSLLTTMLAVSRPAHAVELISENGLDISWDNTLRYSAGLRMQAPNVTALAYPNADDGDRNIRAGLMTNRLDLQSVLDVTTESFGMQLSLTAWYDGIYFSHTDNSSPATDNIVSVPNTQFASAARNLDGRHAELGESFIYGNFDVGGMPLSLRLGRQTLLWGESLFFDQNGIAAGMAPVDYIKKTSTPDGYSRNVFLPVNQLSLTAQPAPDLSLMAYYQFEWRASRLPAVGSYFSDTDLQGAGAERAFLTAGKYLVHQDDRTPPDGGQYGVSLHKMFDNFDMGLYALRYHAKYPVLSAMAGPVVASGLAGTFHSVYPAGIDLYGASFSTYIGASNLAGEISLRRNMPLISNSPVSLTYVGDLHTVYGYARGDTLHGQVSTTMTLGPAALWNSADLAIEIAANDRLATTRDAADLNTGRTRAAASARLLFQPHYFQVLPGLDVTPLFGVAVNFAGRSSIDYSQNAGTGDLELGLAAIYQSAWKVDLTLTAFGGSTYRQYLTDRDFLLFSLERSF